MAYSRSFEGSENIGGHSSNPRIIKGSNENSKENLNDSVSDNDDCLTLDFGPFERWVAFYYNITLLFNV